MCYLCGAPETIGSVTACDILDYEACRKEMQLKITEAETKILNAAQKIKQEQVRKLKEEIYDMYHRIGKSRVWHASNDEVCNLCEDYFERKINEIFPDCAPQAEQIKR